jgi:ATP-dependent DNA helicase RecQ
MPPDVTNPHDQLLPLLKEHFGHDAFRPMQQDIIGDVLDGRDVQVIMPTGGGKSLCYQLPALLHGGVTLVVSPLIALMHDQVISLQANGIRATYINSSLPRDEAFERERQAAAGEFDLVYLAPERLMSAAGQRLIAQLDIKHLAIDEAHCISEWGHDFRPEYRMLGQLRTQSTKLADVPIIALTATATPRVADDIVTQLHMREPARYHGGFERTNLYYEVRPKRKMNEQIVSYLRDHPDDDGIIYCLSRAGTENLAATLRQHGIDALPYHAGMTGDERNANQHAFQYGETRVIVATIAFGMGVDKPNVRFVIHADLPSHIEGYYQATGRAGRDGLPSDCILFFSPGDRAKIERFIEEKPDEKERQHAKWQLSQMIAFAYTTGCRCVPLLNYFGETYPGNCGHCDNCRNPPLLEDCTQDARKLLSAVARTDQRFGLGYIIDVLCGTSSDRSRALRHESLSVWGIGATKPKAHWRRVAEAMIAQKKLGMTPGDRPIVHLTEDSVPVLRGQVDVKVAQPRALAPQVTRQPVLEPDLADMDSALFEKLRELRKGIATEQGVPPYVVFGDVSLRHMAAAKPTTEQAFMRIKGVGETKLARYGPAFLEVIQQHGE